MGGLHKVMSQWQGQHLMWVFPKLSSPTKLITGLPSMLGELFQQSQNVKTESSWGQSQQFYNNKPNFVSDSNDLGNNYFGLVKGPHVTDLI